MESDDTASKVDLVCKAIKMMQEDALLISPKMGTYFWNEDDSAVEGQLREDFDTFSRITTVDLSRIRWDVSLSDLLLRPSQRYDDMMRDYKALLLDLPDKQDHIPRIYALQMEFIMFMRAVILYHYKV